MNELMPESWLWAEEEASRNVLTMQKPKPAQVTNILQWVRCYSAMVGILSKKFPQAVPDLMAYNKV